MVRPSANHDDKGDQVGKEEVEPFRPEMTPIDAPRPQRGEAQRDPAGGTIYKTGRTELNVSGTELSDGLAEDLGLDRGTYTVSLGANPALKLISVYPEPANASGAAAVRRSKNRRTISVHLGGLFKQVPGVRVSSPQACTVTRGIDSKGRECIFISLQTTLDKISGPSRSKGTQKSSKDKPSQEGGAKESA